MINEYKDKKSYHKLIPNILSSHSDGYEAFFVTYTFTDMKQSYPIEAYQEYFKYHRQKLDNALMNNSKAYRKKPILILIPELIPSRHYHGVLLVHKETTNNFNNKCVSKIDMEYVEELDEERMSVRLERNIINPYPKWITNTDLQAKFIKETPYSKRTAYEQNIISNAKPILRIADYRVHPLRTDEVERINQYCFKHFFKSDLSIDDIIIEMKDNKKP